jgi:D-lyxose ketol-isomerase
MKTTKVTNTKKHQTSQGEHLVVEGKLVLLRTDIVNAIIQIPNDYEGFEYYKPLIISETEKIDVGDWAMENVEDMGMKYQSFQVTSKNLLYSRSYCKKILALPEQLSHKHCQTIVDGKMKDGDKVLVECERNYYQQGNDYKDTSNYSFQIKLNQQRHIKLFRNDLEKAQKDEQGKITLI